jgi:hypothetical protein
VLDLDGRAGTLDTDAAGLRHERAVPDLEPAESTGVDDHLPAGDEQPFERDGVGRASRQVEIAAEHDRRPAPGRRAQDNRAARRVDRQRLLVPPAVRDLDDASAGRERRERSADRREGRVVVVRRGDSQHRLAAGEHARVFASAKRPGEPVVERHERRPRLVRREDDPSQHGVDPDLAARRLPPVAEVADDDRAHRNVDRLVAAGRPRTLEQQAPVVAVVLRRRAVERPARYGRGHVERLGEMREHVLGLRTREEGRVVAERAEAEAPLVAGRVGHGRRAREAKRPQPPEEDGDVRDVVAAAAARDPAHVDGMRERRLSCQTLERPPEVLEARGVSQRQEAPALGPLVVQVLRRREQLEGLVGTRGQAGHVARELLEHGGGALAPPVRDRVSDLRPGAERLHGQPGHAEQVADVREHPLRAGLHELVVVQPA